MKKFLVLAGVGFCAILAGPALAQASGSTTPSDGMPTDRSTPAEHAQTEELNRQVAAHNAAIDAKTAQQNAQYRRQQRAWHHQLAISRAAQAQYAADRAAYEALRARYAAERAAYHRHVWPAHYVAWSSRYTGRLLGARVDLYNGIQIGQVDAVARNSDSSVEALRVKLEDTGKSVWIDEADIHFNPDNQIVMTNLDRRDLAFMANEHL